MNATIIKNSIEHLETSHSARKGGLMALAIGAALFPVTVGGILLAHRFGISGDAIGNAAFLPGIAIICLCLQGIFQTLTGKNWSKAHWALRITYLLTATPILIILVVLFMIWTVGLVSG